MSCFFQCGQKEELKELKKNQKKARSERSLIIGKVDEGERLDRYLQHHFVEFSRAQARHQIEIGAVWLNGRVVQVLSRRLKKGDRLTWRAVEEQPVEAEEKRESDLEAIDWEVFGGVPRFLHRDRHLAVLDKPSGIPVEPTQKEDLRICLRQVEMTLREEGVHPKSLYAVAVHRLDAGASGAVAFATSKSAAKYLGEQFADHSAKRVYQALLVGKLPEDKGVLRDHMARVGPGIRHGVVTGGRGKLAITHYRVLRRFADATLVEVSLETGRTHQIRVHFSTLGYPLIGDWLYCAKEFSDRCPPAERMFLHACSLRLRHPRSKEVVTFESPLPKEMSDYIQLLENAE